MPIPGIAACSARNVDGSRRQGTVRLRRRTIAQDCKFHDLAAMIATIMRGRVDHCTVAPPLALPAVAMNMAAEAKRHAGAFFYVVAERFAPDIAHAESLRHVQRAERRRVRNHNHGFVAELIPPLHVTLNDAGRVEQ